MPKRPAKKAPKTQGHQSTSIARRKCYKGKAEASASKRSKGSMDSDDSFHPFGHCVTLLQKIEPKLPNDVWLCAYAVLRDSRLDQVGFLNMDDKCRILWAMQFL
ncbi:hypothetical protein I3760_08G142900 [Carya illinoinensis]|uniref:Uncharacterized protein n=1 Tax=Carya illinoinensis TaxID=32201 RepID=A0A922EFF4_CARIL|nr:hypothetical protein I3760_08G142900 [Carya illinoinensis]KAG6701039.1 hypothetical protein I3842_08G144200 [Carya illinoinensis]KAG6701040.1 hypothetical protein I3842_08G144200 [Carya illinoinensis]